MKDAASDFDRFAEEYDSWYDTPEGNELFRAEVEALKTLMNGLERPFLEIGVGTGRFANTLGIDVGVDPSPGALQIAARRGIKVQQARGESLPFGNESFGAVFLLFTLCFVSDPKTVLFEAKRVLKKSGVLIAGIINKESSWGKLCEAKKAQGHQVYRHARFYGIEKLDRLITDAGLIHEVTYDRTGRTDAFALMRSRKR